MYNVEEIENEIGVLRPVLLLHEAEIDCEKRCAVGFCRFDGSEDIWKQHLVGNPMLPGTYQVEGIAQLCALLLKHVYMATSTPIVVGAEQIRYFNSVKPDMKELTIECEVLDVKRNIVTMKGFMHNNGKAVCKATLKYIV